MLGNRVLTRRGVAVGLVCSAVGILVAGGTVGEARAQDRRDDPKPPAGLALTPAQRQLIYDSISRQTHKSTAAPENFGATVGGTVPESVDVAPFPETLLEVVPQTRGFSYAFTGGQVLIVEPKGRRIVEIIAQGA